jgi:Xaa-Pro aminopeptidase
MEILDDPDLNLTLDLSADDGQFAEFRRLAIEKRPEIVIHDAASLLVKQRMIKHPEEIALIREAITLTQDGLESIMRAIRPGRFEYEVWGAFQQTLVQAGCLAPAFPSIVATGENAFCLHYMTPMSRIDENDLVLIDVGAAVGGLNADISRVYPASGRFSDRQKMIYELVRACQETAFRSIRPGVLIREVNEACKDTAKKGLVQLGILSEDGSATEHYWHGVSHHLGLDVHDPADREMALAPGMVLTVEPGVYVPDWHVGIRIEDDVLVTADGCVNLSKQIPREIAEIEALIASFRFIDSGHASL